MDDKAFDFLDINNNFCIRYKNRLHSSKLNLLKCILILIKKTV